jgi:hypothetical protein
VGIILQPKVLERCPPVDYLVCEWSKVQEL